MCSSVCANPRRVSPPPSHRDAAAVRGRSRPGRMDRRSATPAEKVGPGTEGGTAEGQAWVQKNGTNPLSRISSYTYYIIPSSSARVDWWCMKKMLSTFFESGCLYWLVSCPKSVCVRASVGGWRWRIASPRSSSTADDVGLFWLVKAQIFLHWQMWKSGGGFCRKPNKRSRGTSPSERSQEEATKQRNYVHLYLTTAGSDQGEGEDFMTKTSARHMLKFCFHNKSKRGNQRSKVNGVIISGLNAASSDWQW